MKTKRQKLIIELDKLVSNYIRKRDGRCVTCGSTNNLTCSHLITRACMELRFDLTNCNTQCFKCNYLHEYRPERYTAWWIQRYGQRAYEQLVERSKQTKKYSIDELEDLKELLKGLQ